MISKLILSTISSKIFFNLEIYFFSPKTKLKVLILKVVENSI